MLYTADGLEQASRLEVAATHAGRFYNASLATVHDLGCGIGSDAVAMSALGVTVHGVDVDPVTAAVADINLRPWPDSRARVGLAEEFEPPRDPLRPAGGRVARPRPPHPGSHRTPRADQAGLPARRDPADVGVRAPGRHGGARDGGQALAVDAARRHPARHRGAVDVVCRRGARVHRVVGSAGPATRAQRAHPAPRPLPHRGRPDDGRARPADRRSRWPPSARGSTNPTAP